MRRARRPQTAAAWRCAVAALLLVGVCCSTRQLTPEQHCCKHKARHQARFARSLGLSPPSPVVYRKYYDACIENRRCRGGEEAPGRGP